MPLVARCVNSMMVFRVGATGRMSPLQSGQCCPHPAPLPDAPTYSAVRAKLRVLEEKGHVRHEEQALRYVYVPVIARDSARKSALRHMVSTFFAGSVEDTVAALLDLSSANLAKSDLDR